jgi:hypothetical protein
VTPGPARDKCDLRLAHLLVSPVSLPLRDKPSEPFPPSNTRTRACPKVFADGIGAVVAPARLRLLPGVVDTGKGVGTRMT